MDQFFQLPCQPPPLLVICRFGGVTVIAGFVTVCRGVTVGLQGFDEVVQGA